MNLTFVMVGMFGFGVLALCVSAAMCLPRALRSWLYTLLLLTGLNYFSSPGLDAITASEILNIVVAVALTWIGYLGFERTIDEAPRDEVNAVFLAILSCFMIVGAADYLLF